MLPTLFFSITGMNFLAFVLILVRPKLFGTKLYKPMIKNIGLSILPGIVLLATTIICLTLANKGYQTDTRYLVILSMLIGFAGIGLWLLLLPNAGYLITELNFNHRTVDAAEVPLWYDIISVLSLSVSGILNTCFYILLVQSLYIVLFHPVSDISLWNATSWAATFVLFILVSFGIYLGRFIRFNSWDILHPAAFIKKIGTHYKQTNTVKNCILFTAAYSVFFMLFYCSTVVSSLQPFILFLLS